MPKAEFLFDFGSPNAYLSHLVIPEIEARTGQKFVYEVLGDSACHFYSINMTSGNSDSQLSLISADAYVQIVKC